MKHPVIHTECGGQIGWWLGEKPKTGDYARAKDFERMDGTHSNTCDPVREKCPKCGQIVTSFQFFKRLMAEAA